jgi:hypothetical protein
MRARQRGSTVDAEAPPERVWEVLTDVGPDHVDERPNVTYRPT